MWRFSDRYAHQLLIQSARGVARGPVARLVASGARQTHDWTPEKAMLLQAFDEAGLTSVAARPSSAPSTVTVGLMTAAKLLSAVEPIVRYHRTRFRGGASISPGSPRCELGLQQLEDAVHRLVDSWATGEASASIGFTAARRFDDLEPVERRKDELLRGEPQ